MIQCFFRFRWWQDVLAHSEKNIELCLLQQCIVIIQHAAIINNRNRWIKTLITPRCSNRELPACQHIDVGSAIYVKATSELLKSRSAFIYNICEQIFLIWEDCLKLGNLLMIFLHITRPFFCSKVKVAFFLPFICFFQWPQSTWIHWLDKDSLSCPLETVCGSQAAKAPTHKSRCYQVGTAIQDAIQPQNSTGIQVHASSHCSHAWTGTPSNISQDKREKNKTPHGIKCCSKPSAFSVFGCSQ